MLQEKKTFSFQPSDLLRFARIEPNLDFTLIHCGKRYKCNKLIIASYSNVVRMHLLSNILLSEFVVECGEGPFELVQKYLSLQQIDINDNNALFLLDIATKLGIDDLMQLIFHEIEFKAEEIVDYCLKGFYTTMDIEPLVNIVAKQFDELFNQGLLNDWPVELIDLIMQSPKFKSPCIPVIEKYCDIKQDPNHRLAKFYPFNAIELKNPKLNMNRLRYQLKIRYPTTVDPFCLAHLSYEENNPFDGIIKNVIQPTMTASSTYSDNFDVYNLIHDSEYFCSLDSEDQWFMLDFGDYLVSVSDYAMKTWKGADTGSSPISWILKGSLEGDSWFTIDKRENVIEMTKGNNIQVFKTPNPKLNCRFIKFIQTQSNGIKNHRLCLSRFEIFGTVNNS